MPSTSPFRKIHRHRLAASALGIILALSPLHVALSASSVYPQLFGTSEVRSVNTGMFPKWISMLERHFAEERHGDIACAAAAERATNAAAHNAICAIWQWRTFIDSENGHPLRAQLEEVNAHLNRHRYILDIVNYGVQDYWATPREFAIKDGDCEDFAIAKYFTLRKLGWKVSDLRVVVLQDLNLNIAHAILVAYLDGEVYVLDNQLHNVVPASVILHYRPYYSINEDAWWLHDARRTLVSSRHPR